MIQVQPDDFNPGELIAQLHQSRPNIGAVTSFLGLVRDMAEQPLTGFTLEHYPGMTEKRLQAIENEARLRWNIEEVLVVHRYGELKPADRIVLVAVASAHRCEAFAACEFIIDYLKTQAPFWKKESTAAKSHWVEAKQSDERAATRWQTKRNEFNLPLLAISGESGVGKTTLLERLIPTLQHSGVRVGVIKHSHHHFEIDQPGKDSYRLRQAGAKQVILAADHKLAMMLEPHEALTLSQLPHHFHQQELDLILVEGFKQETIPKIWLLREPYLPDPLQPDPNCIAIATDRPDLDTQGLPRLDLNQIDQVAHFIQQQIGTV